MPKHVILVLGWIALLLVLPAAADEKAKVPPWDECIQVTGAKIFRIEGMCNTYAVACTKTKRVAVVDPCPKALSFVLDLEKQGYRVEAIWITHEHGDHLAGMADLEGKTKVVTYAHAETKAFIDGVRKKGAWGWTDQSGKALPLPTPIDHTLDDGDVVKLGELVWKIRHVPGHSPGSIAFVLRGDVGIVGDVLFAGSIGRTDLPTSDPEVFAKSLAEKLWPLPDAMKALPGHMQSSTFGEEKKSNWLFQDFVQRGRGEPPIARPWLGVMIDRTHEGKGVRLGEIVAEGPAAKAGLKAGDVIVALDGKATDTLEAFAKVYRSHGVGDTLKVRYLRGDKPGEATLELGKRPPQ